jgi:electron transport complex protein RnfC
LKKFSFSSGIHPPHRKKSTEKKQVERAEVPDLLYIPLQQHIGAPCDPLVEVGQQVYLGQKIGDTKAFVSAPVHATVSGIVKDIAPYPHPMGEGMTIVIENDHQDKAVEAIGVRWEDEEPATLKAMIKEAGIVGMGGATFPTHVKLSPPPSKTIDTIILNGAECEPYLTSDHRVMLEKPETVVDGLRIIMKILAVEKGYIGIEDNKPDAIQAMEKACKKHSDVEVMTLKTKYPQGAEKQLIDAITGREVPSGGLPMDVGIVVDNVGTAAAISEAISTGLPTIERVVTVTGEAIQTPKNLMVRIGTTYREIIEQCDGFIEEPQKVISGGPMMGITQYSLDVPVIKGTSGILALTKAAAEIPQQTNCIKCSRCVTCCPINLMPGTISDFVDKGRYQEAEALHALDCIECGSCSFVCPAKRPLTQYLRVAKKEVIKAKKQAIKEKK